LLNISLVPGVSETAAAETLTGPQGSVNAIEMPADSTVWVPTVIMTPAGATTDRVSRPVERVFSATLFAVLAS